MRVGVLRGDLPGPIFLADLEPSSQANFPVEPAGQTRYIGRPDLTKMGLALASAPAAVQGTVDIVFPLTITLGVNDVVRIKVGTGAFVNATIAAAAYATRTTLLTAINAALVAAGLAVLAVGSTNPLRIYFKTTTLLGPGSLITLDTAGAGSTSNVSLGFPAGGLTFTVPTSAAVITALNPAPAGPLNVSSTLILSTVSVALSAAQIRAIADVVAPSFIETDVAKKSFEVGNLKGYLSATYNPDPNRLPALTLGAAISVVQDDGVTAFVAPVPAITGAAHNVPAAGDITITGTGMANTEDDKSVVRITNPATGTYVQLYQKKIRTTLSGGTQGIVTPTSIVIPASLLNGLGASAGTKAQVQYTSLASNIFTVT